MRYRPNGGQKSRGSKYPIFEDCPKSHEGDGFGDQGP